jgi:hypothetical protein
MAVSRVKTSSVLQGFPKYRSMLAGNAAFNPSSFESIATASGTGSSDTITFSSIPSTYTHLQIRFEIDTNSNGALLQLRCNGDTGSNYGNHYLEGNGSTVTASGFSSSDRIYFPAESHTTYSYVGIVDIHDYASTTKYKTVRAIDGFDANGSGQVGLMSGLWMNTAAITSLTFILQTNYQSPTRFSLYGIKGA